jgi:uncharacterized protein YdaU (DUF1376 family)
MRAFFSPRLVADAALANTHLNAQERGAYRLLLGVAWRSTRGLPDDDAKLARWARVDLRTWRRIKPVVMASWTLADGRWTRKRLDNEREAAARRAGTARRDGSGGGRPLSAGMEASRGRAADAAADRLCCPGVAKPADFRALARQHGAGAIAALAAILSDRTAPLGARLNAAQALLDRGFGKPARKADDEASRDVPRDITLRRIFVRPGERDPAGS